MKIAMIGLRGLPATFGGIERHVEELGTRLAARGHEVVAYTRPRYTDPGLKEHRGVRLVSRPAPERAGLEAFVHSGLCAASVVGQGFDVVHFHALGPGLFSPIPLLMTRAAVVQTIHGLDDQRGKWGRGTSSVLRLGGHLSGRVPHEVVVVSRDLQRHYRSAHGRQATYISNGVPQALPGDPVLLNDRFGLDDQGYLLFLGRLVPEKDPEILIRAFRRVDTDLRLVIAGGSADTDRYAARLRAVASADERVHLVGYQYGDALATLLAHAALFVQPSQLEGLPITLLEAAAYGRPVLASDIPPHREVIGRTAPGRELFRTGDEDSLVSAIQAALSDPVAVRDGAKELAEDVAAHYDWDRATDLLEDTYARAVAARRRRR